MITAKFQEKAKSYLLFTNIRETSPRMILYDENNPNVRHKNIFCKQEDEQVMQEMICPHRDNLEFT